MTSTRAPDERPPVSHAAGPESTESRLVTVRYWAAARSAAGRPEDVVTGVTVAEVLAAVRAAHAEDPAFDRILTVSSLLLGDLPLGTRDLATVPTADGDTLEVLPPFAGG